MSSNIAEGPSWVKRLGAVLEPFRPVLKRGEMLTTPQLLARVKISPNTLAAWREQGLQICGQGSAADFYDSDEVIEFMKAHRKQRG